MTAVPLTRPQSFYRPELNTKRLDLPHGYRQILDQFAALDLAAHLLAEPRALVEHADVLARAHRDKPRHAEDRLASAAQNLTKPGADVDAELAQVVDATTRNAEIAQTLETLTRAHRATVAELTTVLHGLGDNLTDALDVDAQRIGAELSKLLPKAEGIADDHTAMRAPKPGREARARLIELTERISELHAAHSALRHARVITWTLGQNPHPEDVAEYFNDHPAKLATLSHRHDPTDLDRIEATIAAGPRVLSQHRYDEREQRLKTERQRQADAEAAEAKAERDRDTERRRRIAADTAARSDLAAQIHEQRAEQTRQPIARPDGITLDNGTTLRQS